MMGKRMYEKKRRFYINLIKKLITGFMKHVDPDLTAYSFAIDENTECSILIERWWRDKEGQDWHSYGTRTESLGENGWTNVMDRLPIPYEPVLVYSKERGYEIVFNDPVISGWLSEDVTSSYESRPWWRPLPVHPKVGAK